MLNNLIKLTLLFSSLIFFNSSKADTSPPPPPPEAIEACADLAKGKQCSFTHPQGILEGLCFNIGPELACAPEDAPGLNDDNPTNRNNFIAHYDANNSMLVLPVVSIANTLYFQVSLELISSDPVLLNLTDLIEIAKSDQVSAVYDEMTEILEVHHMVFDTKHYSLSLKLIRSEPEYQFELLSISELIAQQNE